MIVYIRKGQCLKCGDCCRPEGVPARIEAYEKTGVQDFGIIHGEGCDKFDPETGLCTDYDNRPALCRAFPRTPADIAALPRCGYSFEGGDAK